MKVFLQDFCPNDISFGIRYYGVILTAVIHASVQDQKQLEVLKNNF